MGRRSVPRFVRRGGRGRLAATITFSAALAAALPSLAADSPPAHRHRLIGVAAKSAMMHASVLYHEGAPERTLDPGLARGNAEEIARLAASQVENLAALVKDPRGNEAAAGQTAEMAALATQAHAEADSLKGAIGAGADAQAAVRRRAQRLFHLERRVLVLHQTAEQILGIVAPKDPPAPEGAAR